MLSVIKSAISAASANKINRGVNATLKRFRKEVKRDHKLLKKAKGVLVLPSVIKAGIGIGEEYGEGALCIRGKTIEYYSIVAASIGFQLGAQSRSTILIFLTKDALSDFRKSKGW